MKTIALRHLLSQRSEVGGVGLPLLGVSVAAGVRARQAEDGRPAPSLDLSGYKVVRPDDIIMNSLGKPHGSIGRATQAGITSPAYWVLASSPAVEARYMHHLLRSQWMVRRLVGLGKNQPPNQFDISWEVFRNIEVPLPELAAQRRIADFLDDRVARIDRIIAARRQQAELVDQEVVTQIGIAFQADADMYGAAPLRRYCLGIEQGNSPVAEDRPAAAGEGGLLKTSAISSGTFYPERNKTLPPELVDRRYVVQDGDLLVTRGSGSAALVGDAAVAKLTQDSATLLLSDLTYRLVGLAANPEYACLALVSPQGRSLLGSLVRQGSGPAKARGEDILSVLLPKAPAECQADTVRRVSKTRERARAGSSAMVRSIDLLTEYKTSLITAAVTGELDVTTAGSGIPDTP